MIGFITYTMHLPYDGNRRITEWQGSGDYDRVVRVFKQYVPSWESLSRDNLPRYIPELDATLEVVDYVIPFQRMIDRDGWSRNVTSNDTYGD